MLTLELDQNIKKKIKKYWLNQLQQKEKLHVLKDLETSVQSFMYGAFQQCISVSLF